MITIPEQIWFVLGVGRAEDLSYMCPYDVKKDGTPLASTLKMMETGKTWARGWKSKEPEFKTLTNEPVTGVYIGSSVERYTTSNKLFRVKDPRGFTVEVPTDNIATLLHNSTVVNGYIQEPCVWARDGGHILLPVDSTPYRDAHAVQESIKSENLISATTLNYGDRVMIHSGGSESGPHEFMGRAKITYEVHWVQTERSGYSWPARQDKMTVHPVETITDDKWVTIFCTGKGHKGNYLYELQQSPKITSVEAGTSSHQLTVETLNKKNYYYLPERMNKRLVTQKPAEIGRYNYHNQWSLEVKVVGVELKP